MWIKDDHVRKARSLATGLAAFVALAVAPAAASAAIVDGDFAGGATDASTHVFAGDLYLNQTIFENEDFAAARLPANWSQAAWAPGGGATFTKNTMVVDGARAFTTLGFPGPQSLRFPARFSGSAGEHVGLATPSLAGPWAMFSTRGGDGLYARTNLGGHRVDDRLAVDPSAWHDYEIRWTASRVTFSVDGRLASTHDVALPNGLHVVAGDAASGGGTVTVAGVRLENYPASGQFVSRVFDAGATVSSWGALTATGKVDGVAFETRSGASSAALSAWQTLGAGGAIRSPAGRYVQYRATLSSFGGVVLPHVASVTLGVTPATGGGGGASGPKVVLSNRGARAAWNGRVALRVKCPRQARRCNVAVQLRHGRRAASNRRLVRVRGGKGTKVHLRLRTRTRRYLSTHARVRLMCVMVARDAKGKRRTTRTKVTLLAPSR